MEIETIDEIVEQVADWIGIYGGCKSAEKSEICVDSNNNCCRIGFTENLKGRIYKAIENEIILLTIKPAGEK